MRITDVRAIHVRVEDPNITLFDGSYDDCVIIVETDEGVTGLGEVESLAPAVQAFVHAKDAHNHARGLRNVLLGQDPRDPEGLWEQMYDATDYVGRRGVASCARAAAGGGGGPRRREPPRPLGTPRQGPPESRSASCSAASGTIVCR